MKYLVTDGKGFERVVTDQTRFFNLYHMDIYISTEGDYKVLTKGYDEERDTFVITVKKGK